MDVGYARVSTREQDLDLQRDALPNAGVEKVYWEKVSSRKEERPGLAKALDYCQEGDVLVVYKLDRLGWSLKELLQIVSGLEQRGIGFRSLQEALDTTTPGGRLVFHIFASLAEFERDLIRERTMAGYRPLAYGAGKVAASPRWTSGRSCSPASLWPIPGTAWSRSARRLEFRA